MGYIFFTSNLIFVQKLQSLIPTTAAITITTTQGCHRVLKYRKCSNKRMGHLFNFLRRGGGANSKVGAYLKGGAYLVFQFSASIIRWWLKSLETEKA